MKWVLIGQSVHVVLRRHDGETFCGLSLAQTAKIVASPGFNNRCINCDTKWRAIGRAACQPARVDRRVLYTPRFKFEDWETLP